MAAKAISKIVIVGGGTAGWMTAAALSKFLNPQSYQITLVESDQIGTVGVGEATLPHLRFFNERLGIDEKEFMQKTSATYKLGIEFSNWGALGDAYIHPFGVYGQEVENLGFHHYWLQQRQQGKAKDISQYSLPVQLALAGKFEYPTAETFQAYPPFGYAFHLDALKYAAFLREFSEKRQVTRVEGKVDRVSINTSNGFIESIHLESGQELQADLFIDCSGFRALLLGQELGVEFQDWSRFLPCDRAVAIPSEDCGAPLSYSKAIAREAGWQWRIPLQNRVGNGYVYCSEFISDDEAADKLMNNLDGKPLADLNFLRFKAGRREKTWEKNCVAVGLSSGFLEPLESTSIFLIQIAIMKLIEFFPRAEFDEKVTDEFNRLMAVEYDRIKDFLILHYHATERDDTEFWNYCRTMSIPDSLQHKMDLFREQGHVERYVNGLFLEPSWVAVYLGQRIVPKTYHPLVHRFNDTEIQKLLQSEESRINNTVAQAPEHLESIKKYCHADLRGEQLWPKASMNLYGVLS